MALTRKKRREGGREITHTHRKHTPPETLIVVDLHTHTRTLSRAHTCSRLLSEDLWPLPLHVDSQCKEPNRK